MSYTVILAEKPSVAKSIAKVVGANEPHEGYLQGNGYQVTWAYGHLVTLCDTEDYDAKYKHWNRTDLPIFPKEFKYKNVPNGADQYKIVKKLFENAKEIICATDAGREGEAIFRNIYYHTKVKTPFKRLWISALVDKEIQRGMSDLKDGSDYDNLFYSAQYRAFADWLIGINATRAFTLANYNKGVLSIGRVQTPTFSFICKRYYENLNFVPTTSFIPTCTLVYGKSKPFFVSYPTQFNSKEDAQKILDKVGDTMTVLSKESKLVTEKAPLPFNLSALQQAANKRYNFSAQKTLDILQDLYESKFMSYPRTESSYYNEVLVDEIQSNIGLVKDYFSNDSSISSAVSLLDKGIKNKEAFNDSKVADHHALMPMFSTMSLAKTSLDKDKKKIYDLVTLQMLMSILPNCKKNQTTYKFEYKKGETPMKASGSVIKEAGWRTVLLDSDEDGDDEENQKLPDMKEGDICNVKDKSIREKTTKKPPLLTEASLLKLMETAGKMLEDKELKKTMTSGIGTAATRASIIELIKKRGFVEIKDKKYFVPTAVGLEMYNSIKDLKVASPELTGEWEYKLNSIAEGCYNKDEFLEGIKTYTTSLIHECLSCKLGSVYEKLLEGTEKCPICGAGLSENNKTVYCSKDNPKVTVCGFKLWKTVADYNLTKNDLNKLLNEGSTDTIDTFKSKSKKNFSGKLVLNKDTKTIEISFGDSTSNPTVETELKCPNCGGKIVEKEKMYVCENNNYKDKKSCKFVIWKTIAGYNVTVDDVKEIIETHKLSTRQFISKAKKPFKASLLFNDVFSKSEFMFEN